MAKDEWKELATLAQRLWRGGQYAYFWYMSVDKATKRSQWFDLKHPEFPNPAFAGWHSYFGVHPTSTLGSVKQRGNKNSVSAINCLFGDFDAVDEILPADYAPYLPTNWDELGMAEQRTAVRKAQEQALPLDLDTYKARAWAKMSGAPLAPSWVNDTGGGYQPFWFLTETVVLDDDTRERMALLQDGWVTLLGADQGAKDLARVLRMPGSCNVKAYFAPDYPKVKVVERDLSRLYDMAAFEELTGVDEVATAASKAKRPHRDGADTVIATFNTSVKIGDILSGHGYQLGRTFPGIERYARPGRNKDQTSVVVWTDENRSYHHSSSDVLYTNGHSRDAFDVFTRLYHNGDASAAYVDAKQQQGMWEENEEPPAEEEEEQAAGREDTEEASAGGEDAAKKKSKKRKGPATAIQQALRKLGYCFRFNSVKERIEHNDGRPLHDGEQSELMVLLYEQGIRNRSIVVDVCAAQAWSNRYNPLQELLDGLTWDGDDHIRLLSYYFTDAHPPIEYADGSTETVIHGWLRRWLVGAVGKAVDGIQNPMLVLVSEEQGLGKSEFAKWLCSPLPGYFVESFLNPESVEHQRLATESFIWEVGELGATTRKSDVEALKSFITRHDHSYRAPYARHGVTKPARSSFIGTVNKDNAGFLTDATGNRRFLTVEITAINWKGYVAAMDVRQVWAQAYSIYRQDKDAWQLDEAELAERSRINQDFEVEDPVQDAIEYFYEITKGADKYTEAAFAASGEIVLQVGTRVRTSNTKALQMEVARAMRKLGVTKGDQQGIRGYFGVQLKKGANA